MLLELVLSKAAFCLAIAVLLAWTVFYYAREFYDRKVKKLPPGPYGIPLLGYLPFIEDNRYRKLVDLQGKYGPVMYTRMGRKRMVFLNDYESIRDGLALQAFSGRPYVAVARVGKGHEAACGIFFQTADASWKLARKTASRAVALFTGSRNMALDSIIQKANEEMLVHLKRVEGTPYDPREVILRTCAAVMAAVCFGKEPDLNDPLLKIAEQSVNDIQNPLTPFAVFLVMLDLPNCAVDKLTERGRKAWGKVSLHCRRLIDQQTPDQEIRTIIDAVKTSTQETDPKALEQAGVDRRKLEMLATDMFGAGSADTGDNILWLVLLLATHPTAQKRLQEEIDLILGHNNPPNLEDMENMSYLQACVLEALRWVTNNPFLNHSAMEDTVFRGFFVPKDTEICANWWAANHDPALYTQPMAFDPDRYLGPDGKINTQLASKLLTFSCGPRRCLGDTIAKQMMFLVIGRLFQVYQVRFHSSESPDPLAPVWDTTLMPHLYKVLLTPRS